MYTIKCFIIAVLISVTEAEEKDQQRTIIDDLEQRPEDLLTSLSAEITKSNLDITLSALRVPEEADTETTEANNGSRQNKILKNLSLLKSDPEAASISSAEDAQKITHTSGDNASFIQVKEKMARQGSDEEFAETDEKSRNGNTDDFIEHNERKQASDDLNAEKSHRVPEKFAESKTVNKKDVEVSEISDSVAAEDFRELLKSGAAEEDIDSTTLSRRMLSFDRKLLGVYDVPNIETEPLLESGSGETNYERVPPGANEYALVHNDHHGEHENRRSNPSGANPLAFSHINAPNLPPLTLFHSPGQPLHPHFLPSDNVDKHPLLSDKGLRGFAMHLHEHPHYDETRNHHVNQHFKPIPQLFSQHYEPIQPLQSLQPFHLPQTLPLHPPLQPSQPIQMFQPMQPSQTFHTLESWQPLQHFQPMHPRQPSSLATSSSSKTVASFQPSQMKMDNVFSRQQDASQHPVRTEASNQFSDLFHKTWNVGGFNTFSGV